MSLPIGLVRNAKSLVHKDPNREIQDRLDLIFTTFLRVRSASKVLQFLNTHDLHLPRRDRFGDVVWKKPTVAAILQILKNPAHAGAFVYGKTRSVRKDPTSVIASGRLSHLLSDYTSHLHHSSNGFCNRLEE